jgi:hypothetical protein
MRNIKLLFRNSIKVGRVQWVKTALRLSYKEGCWKIRWTSFNSCRYW